MKPDVSVVIPTRDRGATLSRTLDALELQTPASGAFEVIVVDDGSRDDTPARLEARSAGRFVLRSLRVGGGERGVRVGGGPAKARNAGIALAAAERVLLLGDDTIPRPDTVLRHREAAAGRDVGVQGRVDWHPEEEITRVMRYLAPAGPQFYFVGLRAGAFIPYTGLLGSNFSAPRKWFLSEKFDERFPHAAFEDTELAFRWARLGWRSVFAPEAVCWHSHHYASIEPFLARQNRAGAAARYAVRKHPTLLFRTVLQPLVVGIAHAARARLRRPMRIEDEWDLRTRAAFLRGVAKRPGSRQP
jgi:GT2 family glycosyltransferase